MGCTVQGSTSGRARYKNQNVQSSCGILAASYLMSNGDSFARAKVGLILLYAIIMGKEQLCLCL
jgi:hypothetical protein